LYRKQYLTPTIIHKFVKTTPNPNATKKSSGELCELLPPPPPPPGVAGGCVSVGVGLTVLVDDETGVEGVAELTALVTAVVTADVVACRTRRPAPCTRAGLIKAMIATGVLMMDGKAKITTRVVVE